MPPTAPPSPYPPTVVVQKESRDYHSTGVYTSDSPPVSGGNPHSSARLACNVERPTIKMSPGALQCEEASLKLVSTMLCSGNPCPVISQVLRVFAMRRGRCIAPLVPCSPAALRSAMWRAHRIVNNPAVLRRPAQWRRWGPGPGRCGLREGEGTRKREQEENEEIEKNENQRKRCRRRIFPTCFHTPTVFISML